MVYKDASDDACGAQLLQEHDGQELHIAFLSHTFTDTQWKWSTTEQDTPVNTTASINTLVTSTPDSPATHTHNKTYNPTTLPYRC